MEQLTEKIQKLADKYATTLVKVANQMQESQNTLANMMDELTGSDHDLQGIKALQELLKSE